MEISKQDLEKLRKNENGKEKDWCTKHNRMFLNIEGKGICPECKKIAENDETKLRELSKNWIVRKLGNWKCEKHERDLELNLHNELICPECIDDRVIKGTDPAKIDKRHTRKNK